MAGEPEAEWASGGWGAPVDSSEWPEAGISRRSTQRVVIYDGAFGTYMQQQGLTSDDFGGPELEGCNEMLVLTGPTWSRRCTTRSSESVSTSSRRRRSARSPSPSASTASPTRRTRSTSKAAQIAREVASGYDGFVAGSIGPGTKFASLGQISFADLRDAYEIECRGLLEGGVDLLLIETQFDLLGLKAAVVGARRAMAAVGREVPLQTQVTVELTGRMLPGTEIAAALCAIDALKVDVIGLNCATGPAEMTEHLRHLSQHARMPISCIPNAGLPSVVNGEMHYDLTPDQLADVPRPVHHRARRAGGRRLLRHHAGAPSCGRRAVPRT